MKLPLFALAAALAVTGSALAAPQLPIDQALTLAKTHLATRNASPDQYYISEIVLTASDVRRKSFFWKVTWSESIPLNEVKKETGVEISMDGTLVSVVVGQPNKNPTTGAYDPNGPTGLANPKTRSDRPSILDLKR